MNVITQRRVSRRDWLRHSAGAALALGLWPGCARFADNGRGQDFTFVVINDSHFSTPNCPAFFERVTASIRAHSPRPELCLMLGDVADHGTEKELGPMRDVMRQWQMPFHVVIGNHDYAAQTDRAPYEKIF